MTGHLCECSQREMKREEMKHGKFRDVFAIDRSRPLGVNEYWGQFIRPGLTT